MLTNEPEYKGNSLGQRIFYLLWLSASNKANSAINKSKAIIIIYSFRGLSANFFFSGQRSGTTNCILSTSKKKIAAASVTAASAAYSDRETPIISLTYMCEMLNEHMKAQTLIKN